MHSPNKLNIKFLNNKIPIDHITNQERKSSFRLLSHNLQEKINTKLDI